MAPAGLVVTGSGGWAGGGGSVGPGPLDLAAAGSASAAGGLVDVGSADRRGSAPQRRPSDRGVAAGSADAGGFPGVAAAGWSWGSAGTAGVPPAGAAGAAGAEGRAASPGRGPGLAPPAPGPPVPCPPPGGSGGIAVAGP
jgi:hypothetical protein